MTDIAGILKGKRQQMSDRKRNNRVPVWLVFPPPLPMGLLPIAGVCDLVGGEYSGQSGLAFYLIVTSFLLISRQIVLSLLNCSFPPFLKYLPFNTH